MSVKPLVMVSAIAVLAVPHAAHAVVEHVSVRVDGLGCPFCVHGVDARLTDLAGVDRTVGVKTNLEAGTSRFTWNAAIEFDPADVRRAIREAGFTPRDISVWVTGTAGRAHGDDSATSILLTDGEVSPPVILRPDDRADRRESWRDLLRFSTRHEGARRVRVTGVVRARDGEPSWEIVLDRWAPLKFGALVTASVDEFAGAQDAMRAMKVLAASDAVIHAEAVHATDRVEIWTARTDPDLDTLRDGLASAGCTVADIRVGEVSDDELPE